MLPDLTSAPKPGPGRPPGSRNRRPATRHDAGKTVKRTAAKPQIGAGLRVLAYAVGSERGYLVNPVLEFPDGEQQDGEEGCLSFPGICYDVKRRLNTVARGFTDRGDPVQSWGRRSPPGACSTRPTTWTACCSATGWTPRRGSWL